MLIFGYVTKNANFINKIPNEPGTNSGGDISVKIKSLILAYYDSLSLYGWGINSSYELGISNADDEINKNEITSCVRLDWCNNIDINSIYLTSYLSIYVKHTGLYKLYSMGKNTKAQLGLRKISNTVEKPSKVDFTMFPKLKQEGYTIEFLSKGNENEHTFIVLKCLKSNKQNIYGYGSNHRGQLGLGKRDDRPKLDPILVTALPKDDHVTDIRVGKLHSAFLTKSGALYTVGSYHWGQLGIKDRRGKKEDKNYTSKIRRVSGFNENKILKVGVCNYHTVILVDDGEVYGCGSAFKKATFVKISDKEVIKSKIIDIECGSFIVCMLDDLGNVYVINIDKKNKKKSKLQCLNGDNKDIEIKQISCGYDHSLFLAKNNNIYSYGNNSNSQCSFVLPNEQNINALQLLSQKDDLQLTNKSANYYPIKYVIAAYKTSIIAIGSNEPRTNKESKKVEDIDDVKQDIEVDE